MIERLFTNIKTTIVGLIIFVTGAMLVAFALFFSKDPKSTSK